MRVICIEEGWKSLNGKNLNNYPKIGDVCTAIGEMVWRGMECYVLAEYGNGHSFDKTMFIPADEPEAAVDAVNEILETA